MKKLIAFTEVVITFTICNPITLIGLIGSSWPVFLFGSAINLLGAWVIYDSPKKTSKKPSLF